VNGVVINPQTKKFLLHFTFHMGNRKIETLVWCITANFIVSCPCFVILKHRKPQLFQHISVFSPTVISPLTCKLSNTVNVLYLSMTCCILDLNFVIVFCPPVFHVTLFVILCALVVKSMCSFMAT
jgi:hypothetical protein